MVKGKLAEARQALSLWSVTTSDISLCCLKPCLVDAAAKVSHSKAGPSQKAASAEWLSQVSKPVKGVMSAMQQMASVAVQSNEQTDSSHSRLLHSMTPDALLACGRYNAHPVCPGVHAEALADRHVYWRECLLQLCCVPAH